MRIVTLGDVHCRVDTPQLILELLGPAIRNADVLVLAGDLTDTGKPDEANTLVEQLHHIPVPIVAVLGNHDCESDCPDEIFQIFTSGGVHMLDCSSWELDGITFAGTKGFCGGFGGNLVEPFGEAGLKTFIRAAIREVDLFDQVLAGIQTTRRMAILHYAPVKETLAGEPPEIFPFLGTSRLADPIDRYGVDLVVHGHAHHGFPHGKTPKHIPVHNVCRFVLERYTGTSYCTFDL